MTWDQVAALDRARLVAILPTGAIEAHGPHLPLATDVIIAEAMARAGAGRLAARGCEVLLLPALPFAPAPFAAAFDGTLSVPPEAITALIVSLAHSLAPLGCRALALANAHHDPAQVSALRDAAAQPGVEVTIVFPDLTRRRWAERLTDEFRSGACHAGRYEGSVVLAERPEWVQRDVMAGLPPNAASLSAAIRDGRRTFAEAGGPEAYFGRPAEASAAEGRAIIDVLGSILDESVVAAIGLTEAAS